MVGWGTKKFLAILALISGLFLPSQVMAQSSGSVLPMDVVTMSQSINLDIYVKGPNGEALESAAVVTVMKLNGEVCNQGTTKAGHILAGGLVPTEYKVQVVAPGFTVAIKQIDAQASSSMKVTIQLERRPEGIDAATDMEVAALSPKAHKALGKAMEALRTNKTQEAGNALETASRLAPKSAEVQYFYGVYESQIGDNAKAKAFWTRSLEFHPQHFRALISLGEALLKENKSDEALPYLQRAERSEPSSWRAHALSAEAYLQSGSTEDAVREAERAVELGHGKAAAVQLVLSMALARHGEKGRAAAILQAYLQEHPADAEAKKQLVSLQTAPSQNIASEAAKEAGETVPTLGEGIADALPSSWLPPDIDDKPGAVEPGAVCALDDVLKNVGKRMQEFVKNVDRFTATESIKHETINKWGIASSETTVKFDYLVSVQEITPGIFNVEEYRNTANGQSEFPDGIATTGLPALALIFHPHHAVNFEFACEGLARWNGGLAWQVHFRQRSDKPNTTRRYRLGVQSPSYAVNMKGRAWIAADSYEVIRLETQMIAPVPEIKLAADYTVIEYGPVRFQGKKVEMWLPQSAEVYADWRGRRFHRRHSFSKYMLFSVDNKETILLPKVAEETAPKPNTDGARPNL